MGIDFESYTKEELRMLKFKVGDLIFRSLYPDGFPRSRQEHSDDLNSPVKGDANKNVFRNIFDSDYHDIDESSSEPKIIKKVIVKRVSKDVTGLSFLLEEEEVVEEEEEMEEEEVEEEIVEESESATNFIFDCIEYEYNRIMKALRTPKFDKEIQPEFIHKLVSTGVLESMYTFNGNILNLYKN